MPSTSIEVIAMDKENNDVSYYGGVVAGSLLIFTLQRCIPSKTLKIDKWSDEWMDEWDYLRVLWLIKFRGDTRLNLCWSWGCDVVTVA